MLGEVIELLIALAIAVVLLSLIPKRASRAWALWLLVCLVVANLQWIGQDLYGTFNPGRQNLSTQRNQLEFQRDQSGEVVGVIVNNPSPHSWAGQGLRPGRIAGSSFLLASVALLLLLRAEPESASANAAATSSGQGIGISLQLFGLAALVVTMATAILQRSSEVNLLGVVVIASGYYASWGSRRAGKWALAFMALSAGFGLLLVSLISFGENIEGIGPSGTPWAISIGLAMTAWAVVNLFLTVRFLRQTEDAVPNTSTGDQSQSVPPGP